MADVNRQSADGSNAPTLNQTAYIVLGILSYGYELSGYEIRQWANRSLRAFYKPPAQSQIYRELASLEAADLVESRPVIQNDNPDKVVFALTAAGRAALHEWVADTDPTAMVLKHPLAVQTSFAHGVDSTNLIARLEAHVEASMALLHDLEDLHSGLYGDSSAEFARATLDWAMEIRRADVAGAQAAAAVLRNGSAR